jgi:hypothetical protein
MGKPSSARLSQFPKAIWLVSIRPESHSHVCLASNIGSPCYICCSTQTLLPSWTLRSNQWVQQSWLRAQHYLRRWHVVSLLPLIQASLLHLYSDQKTVKCLLKTSALWCEPTPLMSILSASCYHLSSPGFCSLSEVPTTSLAPKSSFVLADAALSPWNSPLIHF